MKRGDLDRYRAMRDFEASPEPRGAVRTSTPPALRYVIQKHAARRLHYDLRLELDGVLKSWAVPKGPSFDPGEKRLAVEVEDHPLDYGSFEGEIPRGHYGAGRVEIWDDGAWEPLGDPRRGLAKGHLRFRLRGRKLDGEWSLVRMKPDEKGGKTNWLLIRARDGEPPPARAALPDVVAPQLATLVDAVPPGDGWIHEIKLDGYRALARLDRRVTLLTRSGLDWTRRFRPIADALGKLDTRGTLLDGEIVALDEEGRSTFAGLQKALSEGRPERLVYFAFDLLFRDGVDLRSRPLLERKAALETLLGAERESGPLRYCDHLRGSGGAFLKEARKLGLEGVVSKRVDALYRSGRSLDWVKTKCSREQELVIGGYTEPKGARTGFGALLVGTHRAPGEFVYAGRVGAGFGEARLTDLHRRLAEAERPTSPFVDGPTRAESRGVHWTEPRRVARVRFSGWTDDHRLRHPVFEGLREDKPAKEVVEETPKPTSRPAGVRITHPDRVIYPERGLTKLDLALYYESIAELALPHLADRPLSLVRCPDTRERCFYQKNWERMGGGLDTVRDGRIRYAVVRDARGLVALIQNGVLEIHPWGARASSLENPDLLIFDLDPAPDVPWTRVREAAGELRTRLRALDLESFPKATGGKGLHLVVPLTSRADWSGVKDFAGTIAKELAAKRPDAYTATMTKAARGGKIFIDWFRNGRGATAVAAWSTRARPHAPVAAPISWRELSRLPGADAFQVGRVPRRDPWKGFFELRQRLPRR
ncbi:MAG TPA: DNA ligase D [Planctomycetota bacterium]